MPLDPFVLRFRRPIALVGADVFAEPGVHFDTERSLWVDANGFPLYLGGRSKLPPTPVYTAPHTIPAGYTPSGKYKPAQTVPGKMDRRAGK